METTKKKGEKGKPYPVSRLYHMRKIKKALLLIALSCSVGAVSGCSTVIEKQPEIVLIPEYTVDTVPEGVFVLSGETFYQPYNGDKTYSNLPENTSVDRVLWYTDNKIHVPTYKNGDKIVFKSKTNIPNQFVLEGFEHICDSIGIRKIRLNDAGNYVISGDTALHPTSDAYTKLIPYLSSSSALVLDTINGDKIQSNIINKTGSISGLTKDEVYTLGFYVGTQYYEVDIKADTEIYCSKSINTIVKYNLTKNGYLTLQMPDLLTPGLYDINGLGVVNYEGVLQEGQ